jgi:asparagine synthase (glutamine-hydrolysing)
MCGINGFNFQNTEIIKRMNDKIRYRGPDDEGIYINEDISLGHVRLKIIDLSEKAKQPMCNETGNLWITYNGEIYNFQELRAELEAKGHKFKSKSDTEVVLHAYEEYNTKCVNRFNGMWAFCIYDKKRKILFLSRDRVGKKPLYFYSKNKRFIFSSEIKAILEHNIKKELNKKAVSSFLSYRYVLGEETFFKKIKKLLPAHNMIYDLKKKKIKRIWEYWDLPQQGNKIPENLAKKIVEDLIKRSIEYRKISDVPLGVILSGGLDSSLIAAMLSRIEQKEGKQINTFTVKFPEKGFDETRFAEIVAKKYNAKYFEVKVSTNNFLEIMREYIKYKDSPVGVPNEIALYLLSKEIKKNVTVVLSGEGADELFAGYGRKFASIFDFERLKILEKSKNGSEKYKKEFHALYKKYKGKFFRTELDHFLFLYNYWSNEEKNLILKEEAKNDYRGIFEKYFRKSTGNYHQKMSYLFIKLHLPGLLNRLDNPTMTNAVEGRAPFLDYLLLEFVYNLPRELKTRWKSKDDFVAAGFKTCDEISEIHDIPKYILKEIAKGYLPKDIVERKKQGFPLPLDLWFRVDFLEKSQNLLLTKDSKIRSVIKQEKLKEWIRNNIKGEDRKFGQKLWMLVSLELWLREWFPEIKV